MIPVLALALVPACTKQADVGTPQGDPIVRTANALNDISRYSATATDVVISLNLPAEENTKVLSIFRQIVEARIEAGKLLRDVNNLNEVDRAKLRTILEPAFKRFRDATSLAVIGIKNPESQRKVQTYVNLIETAIGVIELALEFRR